MCCPTNVLSYHCQMCVRHQCQTACAATIECLCATSSVKCACAANVTVHVSPLALCVYHHWHCACGTIIECLRATSSVKCACAANVAVHVSPPSSVHSPPLSNVHACQCQSSCAQRLDHAVDTDDDDDDDGGGGGDGVDRKRGGTDTNFFFTVGGDAETYAPQDGVAQGNPIETAFAAAGELRVQMAKHVTS
eukprot:scaffold20131_cov21-Tisochrysis_lutea.AAC.2